MSRHFPWWPWHTIVCHPPCVEVSRGGQQVGMKTARHTVRCQGHQNTQSDVKVIKTHSRMSRSSKHTVRCQSHQNRQSHVTVIKTHSRMSRSPKVRHQGHQNTQLNVKVIKTQSDLKVIKTQSDVKVIKTQSNVKVIKTQSNVHVTKTTQTDLYLQRHNTNCPVLTEHHRLSLTNNRTTQTVAY